MQDFIGQKILVGICGGIAAYKSAYLVRELSRLGAEVRVVMTESAQQFITPLSLQALSGHEVRTTLWDEQAERGMGHIELARWADYLVIAPASANTIAKLSQGLADDLLSTLYLVAEIPVILCPGMNQSMWHHPATVDNCARLVQRGVCMVGPEEGAQACGDYGFGRLTEADAIVNALRLQGFAGKLANKKVLITAGPSQEALDPVRFLSNRSSGKMGYALAMAAVAAGAQVTLVSGPTTLAAPQGLRFISVISAKDMYEEVMGNLQGTDLFIGCAAVADYTPEEVASQKIKKKGGAPLQLTLSVTKDIVASVAASGKAAYVVGFSAETEDLLANARKKCEIKKLDMIIANRVGEGLGFEEDCNEVIVITKDKEIALQKTNKVRLAGQLMVILSETIAV